MASHPKVEKWLRWLKTIDDEVTSVFLYRDTWRSFATMIDSNRALPRSHFFGVIASSYAASQAVAVRRIADAGKPGRPVVSLARLIADIQDSPQLLTRDKWLNGLVDPAERAFVGRDWDRTFAGLGNHSYFDPAIARADLSRLAAATNPIANYVDQYLAHRDPRPRKTVPKYEDLHSAIDVIGELFRRYYLLLRAADRSPIAPILPANWLSIFEIQWKPA